MRACDGLLSSNTYLLEKLFKWKGILVEPATYWHKKLKLNRNCSIETSCVYSSSNKEINFRETVKKAYHQLKNFAFLTNIKFKDMSVQIHTK